MSAQAGARFTWFNAASAFTHHLSNIQRVLIDAQGVVVITDAAQPWNPQAPGVIEIPSGRRFRGRALRGKTPKSSPLNDQEPTLAVHLTQRLTAEPPWDRLWVRWSDFWLPSDSDHALRTLRHAYEQAFTERVEIACAGGIGRTGTGLAALCVFDGMEPDAAVNWVRAHYHARAVEVPWQRRFLRKARNT